MRLPDHNNDGEFGLTEDFVGDVVRNMPMRFSATKTNKDTSCAEVHADAEDSANDLVVESRCFIQRSKAPLLKGLTTDSDCYLRGRAVASELDIALVKTWMRMCNDSHTITEVVPGLKTLAFPRLVIDVNEEMVLFLLSIVDVLHSAPFGACQTPSN